MTHHLTEPRRRVDRLAGLWADTAWPVLAGALTATGLIGAWRAYGLIAAVLIFIGLWAFAATLTYGICSESGISPERTVRLSFAGTLLVVVLMGLLELFPVGGWLAAAVVALTSPVVTTWLVRRCRAVSWSRGVRMPRYVPTSRSWTGCSLRSCPSWKTTARPGRSPRDQTRGVGPIR